MLDGVDPGVDGVLDGGDAVTVGGDRKTVPVCLVDHEPQLAHAELALPHRHGRCQEPAADHHLHHVTSAIDAGSDGSQQLPVTRALAAEVPAVTALRRDRWAGGEDRRQRRIGAQGQRDEPAVAEIAQCGHTAEQGTPGRLAGADRQVAVVDAGDLLLQRARSVEAQVLVAVDQPGSHRAVIQLDERGVGGRADPDVDDHGALHQQDGRIDRVHAVEQPCCPDGHHAGRFTSDVSETHAARLKVVLEESTTLPCNAHD